MIVIMRGNMIIKEKSEENISTPYPVQKTSQTPVLYQKDTEQSKHDENTACRHAHLDFPLKIVKWAEHQCRDKPSTELAGKVAPDENSVDQIQRGGQRTEKRDGPDLAIAKQITQG